MRFLILLICCVLDGSIALEEFIKWNQIEYENLTEEGSYRLDQYNNVPQGFAVYKEKGNFQFVPYNNVPQGFAVYKDKIFIAVPRRRPGIPSTLNYIKLDQSKNVYVNPKLNSYPDLETNELDPSYKPNPNRIISVYRPRVDECERLWFVDSGIINTSGNVTIIQRPSIWVIDLEYDEVVSRYEIPESLVRDGLGLASITIDVLDCEKQTFAYIPDLVNSIMLIYNLQENKAYKMEHNYFRMNPFEGDFYVDGLPPFSWDDGIFSITLSNMDKYGHRIAYFHPMISFSEFAVSTRILRNETLAKRSYHGKDVKFVGDRGQDTQSSMHSFHAKTGVIYFAQINKNAIACWNSNKDLKPSNFKEIVRDDTKLVYPSDLSVVNDDLWVMSNRMIRHIYSKLDTDDINFRIFRISIEDAKCNVSHQGGRKYRHF